MLPSKSWESAEVGVGGYHGAAVLDRNRRVLGVGDQLPVGPGLAAQSFEDVQMVGTGTHDARGRALHQRVHEREGLVESGRRVEDSGVGHNANEAGQNEDGKSERLRSCRQASDPGRILGVFRASPPRAYISAHLRREAASRTIGARARTGPRHPVHRAPSAGRDRLLGGRERHAQ